MFPETSFDMVQGVGAADPDRIRRAYNYLVSGWPAETPANQEALYSVLAVSGLESSYGVGFGEGVNNWGAIQCKKGPPCDANCIEWGDSHADGTGYRWCYSRNPTPEKGAEQLARYLIKRVGMGVLSAGHPDSLAEAMFNAGYYEGRGKTREERIGGYASALRNRFSEISAALGGSAPSQPGGSGGSAGWGLFGVGLIGAALLWRSRRG